jgi:hypothetical protein
MHKIISAAALVLIAGTSTFVWMGTAAATPKIIIKIPKSSGAGGPVTSPGEPFQPFQRSPGGSEAPGGNSLAEACDDLGGQLMQLQDGARVEWVCVR